MPSFTPSSQAQLIDRREFARRDCLYLLLTEPRYLTSPKLAVLHQEDSETAPVEVCQSFSESLVKSLWPGCKVGDNGPYGRAILFEYPANSEAMMHVFEWIKESVEKGTYQELDKLTWRRSAILPRMKEAARVMEIEKLTTIVDTAMASGVLDAAETVQQ